jgi:transcription factor E
MQKNNKKATHSKGKAGTRPAQKHKAVSKTKKNPTNSRFAAKHKISTTKTVKKSITNTKKHVAMKSIVKNTKAKPKQLAKPKQIQHISKSAPTEVKAISDRKAQSLEKAKKQKELDEATYTANAMKYIEALVEDTRISDYLNKNVSRHASEVIDLLTTPRTDEEIAAALDLKINAVRRILNIMQGYGITNYNVSKNNEGWLSFAWYINTNKVPQFFDYVKNTTSEKATLKDDCNDYFICKSCYDDNKFIFTFDAAYESGFKCNICSKQLHRIDRGKASELLSGAVQEQEKLTASDQ